MRRLSLTTRQRHIARNVDRRKLESRKLPLRVI
jgi:hypothetical protein